MAVSSDFKDLLRLLSDYEVKYLVVGGYAVIKYTEPRYTKDLDLWIRADSENAASVYRALQTFGAPLEGQRYHHLESSATVILRDNSDAVRRFCRRPVDSKGFSRADQSVSR